MVLLTEIYKMPILPNKGAAGLKLKSTTSAVRKLWGEPLKIEQISKDDLHWEYQDIGLWFKSDKLDQIGVEGLYEGKTSKKIGIGSTRAEVELAYGELSWDGTWLINNPPFGIGFDFTPNTGGQPRVVGIFIFRD